MTRRRLAVIAVLAVIAIVAVTVIVRMRQRPAAPPEQTSASTSSLLVLTWAPSLCEVDPANTGCRSGHVGSLGRSFVLHGLWPQPSSEQYCDVPKRTPDKSRAPVPLPDDLKTKLRSMMSDSALMTTHEWYAHGTCSGVTPSEYFGVATVLAKEATAVLDPLFARSSGRLMSSRSVREALDGRFGAGAGARAMLACRDLRDRGSVVYEVRLSLPPVARLRQDAPSLRDALAGAPAVPPGCGGARLPD